jgi:LacI family transcriptional regulator
MATIRDVARLAGVSTATVSHVLHGRTDKMSEQTRERVLAAVRELRYRPTAFEQREGKTATKNLAVVAVELTHQPIVSNNYYGYVLDGIVESSALRGYSVTLFVERMWDEDGHNIRRNYDGKADGVIFIAPDITSETVPQFVERGSPIVVVGTTWTSGGVSTIDIDNHSGGELVTQHLIDLGHRRIAYIGFHRRNCSSLERCEGYRRALHKAGISFDRRLVTFRTGASQPEFPSDPASVDYFVFMGDYPANAMDHLFALSDPPTALVCWNADIAISCSERLSRQGISVPNQVSMVCFDDHWRVWENDPPLTTVRQPLQAIGRRAAAILIERAIEPSHPDEHVRYEPELIVRSSTGPAPGTPRNRLNAIPHDPNMPPFIEN